MKTSFDPRAMFDPRLSLANARMRTTAPTASTTEAAPLTTPTPPEPSVAAPAVLDPAPRPGHPGMDTARELSGRARVRHDDDSGHGDHGNRRVAPGAMRFAQKMVHLVRDEMRDLVGDKEALDEDQRDALKQAGKDLRRDVRDAASQFTLDDGSLDLAGFFGALGDSVMSFAETVGSIVTPPAEESPAAPEEEPTDDTGLSGPVAPTRSDDPTPTLDPGAPSF